MNGKVTHIFTGIDTDSHPMSVKSDKAEEIHNLRISSSEQLVAKDSNVLNDPANPLTLTISPELGTIQLLQSSKYVKVDNQLQLTDKYNVPIIFGQYVGHCVCNDELVIFSMYKDNIIPTEAVGNRPKGLTYSSSLPNNNNGYDMIVKYKLSDDREKLSFDYFVILAAINRDDNEENCFDINNPIESLFCYENTKIQRLYWVDGKNQPRSINISDYIYTEYRSNGNSPIDTFFTSYNDLNFSSDIHNVTFDVDINNNPSGNGEFKPGTVQYVVTLIANNDSESSIAYISPMYYLSPKDRGEDTTEMVRNVLTIKLSNFSNTDNFKKVCVYAITRTSPASINARLLVERYISNNIIVVDDGKIGSTVDYTSLFYKGAENIVAYTLDQKDGTLFLGKLKYKKQGDLPVPEWHRVDAVGVDYYGHAVYDYANYTMRYKEDEQKWEEIEPTDGVNLQYQQMFWNEGVLTDDNIERKTKIRPDVSDGIYQYHFDSPFNNMYYKDSPDNTRSSRAIKRFKSGEFYKIGIVGQYENGKMTKAIPLDIVYNAYKPIFKQYVKDEQFDYLDVYKGSDKEGCDDEQNNVDDIALELYDSQKPCYITTGFRVLLDNKYIQDCLNEKIVKLYPVVVYPNFAYKSVLTQGILSPTLFNVYDRSVTHNNIASWYYRPYGKGIFNDCRPFKGQGTTSYWTAKLEDDNDKLYKNNNLNIYKSDSVFRQRLMYQSTYNFACITTGSHYRGLYSNAFPNGEIECNNIGSPVDYRMITCTSKGSEYGDDWTTYTSTFITKGDHDTGEILTNNKYNIRLDSPVAYERNGNNLNLLNKHDYSQYFSDNFLMNCNILTLNSPETELENLFVNSTRGVLGNGYKLRIVGFSDYCTNRILKGEKGRKVSDIQDEFRIAKKSGYSLSYFKNSTYIKNRTIAQSSDIEDICKRFIGHVPSGADNGHIRFKDVYLGDCTWSYTDKSRYDVNMNGQKISYNLSYGTTDYHIVKTKENNGIIPMFDFVYVSEASATKLNVEDMYEDYDLMLTNSVNLNTTSYQGDNMFNEEEYGYTNKDGCRYTKLYPTNDTSVNWETKNRYLTSWAASPYVMWHSHNDNDTPDGPHADFDLVYYDDESAQRNMYNNVPHINWWYPGTTPSTGDTSESIHTIFNCLPLHLFGTSKNKYTAYKDSYYSKKESIGIKYNLSSYIAISLGKTNPSPLAENSDYVLCSDGYGIEPNDTHPYWIEEKNKDVYPYSATNVIDKVYGYLDSIGQFIGELYREPEDIGIEIAYDNYDDNIKYPINIDIESSSYMGGISEDPNHNWIICGEGIDLTKGTNTVRIKDHMSNTASDDGWIINDKDYYELIYIEGDTYVGRFDSLKTYPYNSIDQSVVESFSTVLESSINLDERVDERDGDARLVAANKDNFNKFNEQAYNQVSTLTTSHTQDPNAVVVEDFPNTITWSLRKVYGASVDEWTHITMTSTLDLDGQYGVIEYLANINNNVFAFQNQAISLINFNSRVQIPTSDNNPIEITNGYKVDGKNVITDIFGCSNKWSIVKGANGLYFVDDINNKACLFNGQQTSMLSVGVQRFFNTKHTSGNQYYEENLWNPNNNTFVRCFYDNRRKEVYYIFKDIALVYNEMLGVFTGTLDYGNTKAMFNIGDYFGSIYGDNNDKLYQLFSEYTIDNNGVDMFRPKGIYNTFYTKDDISRYKDYYITYIEHGESIDDKVFSTVEWQSTTTNVFDELTVDSLHNTNTSSLNYGYRGNVKCRYNYYRACLNTVNNSKLMYKQRNPYFRVKLKGDVTKFKHTNAFAVNLITTTFSY